MVLMVTFLYSIKEWIIFMIFDLFIKQKNIDSFSGNYKLAKSYYQNLAMHKYENPNFHMIKDIKETNS